MRSRYRAETNIVIIAVGMGSRYRTETQGGPSVHTSYTSHGFRSKTHDGFIKGILRGVRCTKSLRVLFLHRRPPSWTTLVLYSRVVFIFNEPTFTVVKMQLFLSPNALRTHSLFITLHENQGWWHHVALHDICSNFSLVQYMITWNSLEIKFFLFPKSLSEFNILRISKHR